MPLARSTSILLSAALFAAGALLLSSRQSFARTSRAPVEYKAVPMTAESLSSASAQQAILDENGKDGWQLVLLTPVALVFRR